MKKMNENLQKDLPGMFEGNMYKLLIRLSLPILTGMAVQILYTVADTFFISLIDKTDPSYIGGTGLVFPLMFLSMSIASGIMTGVGSVVARAIGEKNRDSLNKAAESSLIMGAVLAIGIMAGIFWGGESLVKMLGATGNYYQHGLTYLLYSIPFMGTMIVIHAIGGIFQGEGKMKYIMIAMLIGTMCNLVLDPIFILWLKLGVKGAALASDVGQIVSFIYALVVLGSKENLVSMEWKLKNIDIKLIRDIAIIGFPMALGQMAMALSIMLFNRMLITIDQQAMAAFTLVGRFDQGVLMPVFALSSAMITVVGQNVGRGNMKRIRVAWKSGVVLSGGVVLFLATAHILLAPVLYRIFSDVPQVLHYCILQTRILEYTFLFAVIGIIGRSVFQAIGYPIPALILTIVRTLAIGFPLAYIFVYHFNLHTKGVYFGMIIGNTSTAVIGLLWIASVIKRLENGTLKAVAVGR
jgi:putative MATE family efflux protein